MKLQLLFVLFLGVSSRSRADKPCAARATADESVVCVCTPDYCDELTRIPPASGQFVAYSSSEGGLRFNKLIGDLEENVECSSCTEFTVSPDTRHQAVEGFGGAVTDAAGVNWRNLSDALQEHLIESYYGDNGLQYNMIRVPIGGSDFSTHPYAYNELPENDTDLSNYSLSIEDIQYKLPFIKQIMSKSSTKVHIVATTWSPPGWMKTNHEISGFSQLKEEFYQTYALYHLKFLEMYSEQGVPIWALTTTNEPVDGRLPFHLVKFNTLGWSPLDLGKWVMNNLGPKIRNSTFSNVKILINDDQRYSIPLYFNKVVEKLPKVLDYIDGVAVHFYGDMLTPASILSDVPKKYPGKFVLATEACEGSFPWQKKKVLLGSWDRAETYAHDILEDLNHDVVGWIDWNLCLDAQGGPNWASNFVDSPIIVFPEREEFIKQPMFYAMGHFSKFVPRGSVRIDVKEKKGWLEKSIQNVAFITPHGTVVVVLFNNGKSRKVVVKLGNQQAKMMLDEHSINTIEMEYNQ